MIKFHLLKLGTLSSQIGFLLYALFFVPKLQYAVYADYALLLASFSFLNLGIPFAINTYAVRNEIDEKGINYLLLLAVIIYILTAILVGCLLSLSYSNYYSISVSSILFLQFVQQSVNSIYRVKNQFKLVAFWEFIGQFSFLSILIYDFSLSTIVIAFILKWLLSLLIPIIKLEPFSFKKPTIKNFFKEAMQQLFYNYLNIIPSLMTKWFMKSLLSTEGWASASLVSSLVANGLVLVRNQLYLVYNRVFLTLRNKRYVKYEQYKEGYSFFYYYILLGIVSLALIVNYTSYFNGLTINYTFLIVISELWPLIFWHMFVQSTAKIAPLIYSLPVLYYITVIAFNYSVVILLSFAVIAYQITSKISSFQVLLASIITVLVLYLEYSYLLLPLLIWICFLLVYNIKRHIELVFTTIRREKIY